jgi:hypothetical protein
MLERYIENLQEKKLGKSDISLLNTLGFKEVHKILDEKNKKL